MYNLNLLSDEVLLRKTQHLIQQERETLTQILHHLREIERRRLFCKLKLGSLFDYAVKVLGYSEDQAYRRIQAMRLLKELPTIEEKINDGKLNLTHLGMAQSLFKREEKESPFSYEEKIEILEKLEGTTKREAEKVVSAAASNPPPLTEKIRAVSEDKIEVKFFVSTEGLRKIQKLKGIFAHKNPNIQLGELFESLCDLGIEKWGKNQTSLAAEKPNSVKALSPNAKKSTCMRESAAPSGASRNPERAPAKKPTSPAPAQVFSDTIVSEKSDTQSYLSKAEIKRQVWRRDKGRCQICKSEYAIEIDHQTPKAMGGKDTLENLRLLCKSCNQYMAIQAIGLGKMDPYLN